MFGTTLGVGCRDAKNSLNLTTQAREYTGPKVKGPRSNTTASDVTN